MEQANSNLKYSESEALEVECIDENKHLLEEESKENLLSSLGDDITLQEILTTIDSVSTSKHIRP